MPETLIKVDLTKPAPSNEMVHNRWHPEVPMACWVNPGDDFVLETYDWTGGFIKNNDSADDVRDIDLTTVHYLSGPVGVKGAEPGDLLVVDLLDIGAEDDSLWGFNGFFSKTNGGGFLTDHFPAAQKSIWDFHGMFTSSRHVPGVRYAGLIHPGLIGTLPDPKMLADWNAREQALIDTNPTGNLANPIFKPSPITPTYNDYVIFEGISVDESGKQYYLDVNVAYKQACLNAIEYLKKFGYSGAQAYSILGTAPVQGHISGVVDVPNACATLWLPTQIFDFDINPSAAGPIKHLDGSIDMPISYDLK